MCHAMHITNNIQSCFTPNLVMSDDLVLMLLILSFPYEDNNAIQIYRRLRSLDMTKKSYFPSLLQYVKYSTKISPNHFTIIYSLCKASSLPSIHSCLLMVIIWKIKRNLAWSSPEKKLCVGLYTGHISPLKLIWDWPNNSFPNTLDYFNHHPLTHVTFTCHNKVPRGFHSG